MINSPAFDDLQGDGELPMGINYRHIEGLETANWKRAPEL